MSALHDIKKKKDRKKKEKMSVDQTLEEAIALDNTTLVLDGQLYSTVNDSPQGRKG